MSIKALEEQVAQQALLAEQAEQAAQQAREAKAMAEQELLQAMLKEEQEAAEVRAQAAAMALKAKRVDERPLKMPKIEAKIMERSYQRAKTVGSGTQLSSGAKQATVTFKPGTFRLLEMAAAENSVSLSEMVRQLVDKGLHS